MGRKGRPILTLQSTGAWPERERERRSLARPAEPHSTHHRLWLQPEPTNRSTHHPGRLEDHDARSVPHAKRAQTRRRDVSRCSSPIRLDCGAPVEERRKTGDRDKLSERSRRQLRARLGAMNEVGDAELLCGNQTALIIIHKERPCRIESQ